MWRDHRSSVADAGWIEATAQHLRSAARGYHTDLPEGSVEARYVGTMRRATTLLVRFDLHAGGRILPVLVKSHADRPKSREKPLPHWPRLEPCPEPSEAAHCEFRALSAIESHFARLGDPSFGTVRALDLLPDGRTLVLEFAPGETLDRLLARCQLLASASTRRLAEVALRNAGAWLAHYQKLPDLTDGQPYRPGREGFVDSIREIAGHLLDRGEMGPFVQRVAGEAERSAEAFLPADLSLGLSHGDFWPGNVVVGAGGRVTVIDTYGRWRTPVHEDLGYFLGTLRSSANPVLAVGAWLDPAKTASFERAFLAGYFEDAPADLAAVRLFEILTILNKWGLALHNLDAKRGPARAGKLAKMRFRRRMLRRRLEELVAELKSRRLGKRPPGGGA